jgi:hypothetical protein
LGLKFCYNKPQLSVFQHCGELAVLKISIV